MTTHILEGLRWDTPTHRRNIAEMPENEVIELLDLMRTRRLAAYVQYRAAQEARAAYQSEISRQQMDHQLRMMEKEFGQVDRAMLKLEKRCLNIAALRLEIE